MSILGGGGFGGPGLLAGRRRSAWTPAALGSGLRWWLEARRITGLANGAVYTGGADLSGAGHVASTTDATTAPVWLADADGAGRPGLSFDGINDFLTVPTLLFTGSGANVAGAFFIRFRYTGAVANYATPVGYQNGGRALSNTDNSPTFGVGVPGSSTPVASVSGPVDTDLIIVARWTGNSITVDRRGVGRATGTGGAATGNNPLILGRHITSGFSWFRYRVLGVGAVVGTVSDADTALLLDYLAY